MQTDSLLNERATTHGDFQENALVAQIIKAVIAEVSNGKLSHDMREALDLIATKIARICSGDPNTIDHWKDIAGYSQLIVNILEKQNEFSAVVPTGSGFCKCGNEFRNCPQCS